MIKFTTDEASAGENVCPRSQAALHKVSIQSGGLHVSEQPTLVCTVLGSCVSACVFDREAHVGGMNHFMLPDGCATDPFPNRFGTCAMLGLLSQLARRGARREHLRAKIFGGAHVLRNLRKARAIPEGNIEFARRFLGEEGIPIGAERVGGELPMNVQFETHTGRAFVRTVQTLPCARCPHKQACVNCPAPQASGSCR